MTGCVFCRIVAGQEAAEVLYEDEEIMAFKDIHPAAPVHVLIIPKAHYARLEEVPHNQAALLGRLFLVARDLAERLGIQRSGYRLILNNGPNSGQIIFHIHLHLLGGRRLGKLG